MSKTALLIEPRQFAERERMFGKMQRLYFIGIGGAGMSGIAEILHNLGYQVRGSDAVPSEMTQYLEKIGVEVYPSHQADQVADADVVVISSAVGEANPEVVEARRRSIPVIKRAEMLGELMRLKFSIGIAGTHGKTTTTSMIGRILRVANQNPTLIVGGVVAELGTGATLGSGQYLVAEADEYDKSFLAMFPSMAVVLNIEADHLDCYRDFDEIKESFLTYMNRVPFFGAVIASADDPAIASIRSKIARPTHTFGFSVDADYRAVDVKYEMGRSRFTVFRRGNPLGEVILRVPGRHNVANALAAIAATFELDIPFLTITDALRDFTGVGRRFEIIGEENGVLVIDDYAHHPTEIRATLTTAKETLGRRIVAVFQPHLYSRTRDFVKDFATALDIADEVFLTDIYPAREVAIPGVTSELIRDESVRQGGKRFTCVGTKDHAIAAVVPHLKRGDAVLLIGAGSITYLKQPLLETIRKTTLA